MFRKGKSNSPDLSIILTGFNEGTTLGKNLKVVRDLLNNSRYSWEIILYDDKSSDDTPKIFERFAAENKNVHAFFHTVNKGRGRTVKDAIFKSKGRIVGYFDTDLELSPAYLFEFVNKIGDGHDVAIGRRFYTIGAANIIRTVISKGYILLRRLLIGLPFKDTEAGIKFFNRKKILPVLDKVKDERWFFDTEIVARSYLAKLSIIEIPVVYVRNTEKRTSVKLFKDSFDYFRQLLAFRKIMNQIK